MWSEGFNPFYSAALLISPYQKGGQCAGIRSENPVKLKKSLCFDFLVALPLKRALFQLYRGEKGDTGVRVERKNV